MSKLFKSSKSVLYIWIIGLIIYVITLIAGALLFPGHYTILKNYISDLGSPKHTPYYWLSTIGHLTIGLVSLIVVIRVIFQLKKSETFFEKIIKFLALFMNILACFGFFGVAIINEDMGVFHDVSAILIFGGFTFGSIFMGQTGLNYSSFEKPLSKRNFRKIGIIIFLTLFLLEVVSLILVIMIGTMSFTEWMSLICFLVWLFFLTLESTMSPVIN